MIMSDLTKCKQSFLKLSAVLVTAAFLAACGGGGGKKTPTPTAQPTAEPTAEPTQEPDITPEEFTFELPAVDPAQGESVAWPAVEISGLGEPVTISISGGEYAIDGGAFTSEDGTVTNGQSIVIRATAASAFDGEQPVSITVGDYTTSFTLTTESQDLLPETFSFAAVTEAERGAQVASPAITVAGINDATAISIVNGEYALDGGDFISTAGQVMNGQSVAVRVTASSEFSSTEAAELTIGGVAASFSVTTLARDVEPDAFSFVDQTDVDLGVVVTSAPITVSGINDAAAISITGGEYAIDGGEFSSVASTVSNGQEVVVRITAGSATSETVDATLTVTEASATFSATTFADTTAPTAKIAFPPPTSLTESTSVMVRGTAEDDYNEISSLAIFVNGVDSGETITTTDGFANWSVQLPLNAGDNDIEVVVTDSEGNTDSEAASVNVKQGSATESFPHDGVPFNYALESALNTSGPDPILYLTDSEGSIGRLVEVNLTTGVRTERILSGMPEFSEILVGLDFDDDSGNLYLGGTLSDVSKFGIFSVDTTNWTLAHELELSYESAYGAAQFLIDDSLSDDWRLYFVPIYEDAIAYVDKSLTSFHLLSSNSVPGSTNPLYFPGQIALDDVSGEVLTHNQTAGQTLLRIDPDSGARTVVSDASASTAPLSTFSTYPGLQKIDIGGVAYLLVGGGPDDDWLTKIDLQSGERSVFSAPTGENVISYVSTIKSSPNWGYVLVFSTDNDRLFAIDTISEQRVIISTSGAD